MHSTVPHLAVPFRISGTRAETVEDGTLEEVTQNVRVILTTHRGSRLAVPTFGIPDPTFGVAGGTPNPAVVQAAVEEWEPRAEVELIYGTPSDDGVAPVQVLVSMEEG